tara:strand:+ start:162 stop:1169 length:1008 start_codon:yes stop_codon:yes gene_type:complete
MSKLLGGKPSDHGTDKSALIASWCAAQGDKRTSMKPDDKSSALVDVKKEKDEDDVSTFSKFAAEERSRIADLGLQVDEAWILKEINRRWLARGVPSGSVVTDTSKSKVVPKAKVKEEPKKEEPSKEKVEMSDIELPDNVVQELNLVFVGKFRDKFMYRSKEEEPKVEVKVESKKKSPLKSFKGKPAVRIVEPAISKRKSKVPVKASVDSFSPGKGSSSKGKPWATKAKPPVITKQDADMAQWFSIATGRIYDKSSKDEKARAWVKQGLELYDASFDTPAGEDADNCEAVELARQLMMVTDDEEEEEMNNADNNEDDADFFMGEEEEEGEEESDRD